MQVHQHISAASALVTAASALELPTPIAVMRSPSIPSHHPETSPPPLPPSAAGVKSTAQGHSSGRRSERPSADMPGRVSIGADQVVACLGAGGSPGVADDRRGAVGPSGRALAGAAQEKPIFCERCGVVMFWTIRGGVGVCRRCEKGDG